MELEFGGVDVLESKPMENSHLARSQFSLLLLSRPRIYAGGCFGHDGGVSRHQSRAI